MLDVLDTLRESLDARTSVALVQEAFAQGYARGEVMHLYPSLASLRDDPAYQELLKPKE